MNRKEYLHDWYIKNKNSIKEKNEERRSKPRYKQMQKKRSAKYYQLNKNEIKHRQSTYNKTTKARVLAKTRREKRIKIIRQFVNNIKLQMDCQNPNCKSERPHDACELDFHHLDDKCDNVSVILLNKSRKSLISEIKKCTILCANCHRRATFGLINCSNFKKCDV